jgi:hypothetical protein
LRAGNSGGSLVLSRGRGLPAIALDCSRWRPEPVRVSPVVGLGGLGMLRAAGLAAGGSQAWRDALLPTGA